MIDKKAKILLVEDNEGIQQAVALLLTHKFKCKVFTATTGGEAVQMAENMLYDLIFINIDLPGLDSIEIILQIKQLNVINYETPIIALTAYEDNCTKQKCIAAGINGFLQKPFTYEEMREILGQFKLI